MFSACVCVCVCVISQPSFESKKSSLFSNKTTTNQPFIHSFIHSYDIELGCFLFNTFFCINTCNEIVINIPFVRSFIYFVFNLHQQTVKLPSSFDDVTKKFVKFFKKQKLSIDRLIDWFFSIFDCIIFCKSRRLKVSSWFFWCMFFREIFPETKKQFWIF